MKKQQLRAAAEKAQIEINDQINQFILSSLEGVHLRFVGNL